MQLRSGMSGFGYFNLFCMNYIQILNFNITDLIPLWH